MRLRRVRACLECSWVAVLSPVGWLQRGAAEIRCDAACRGRGLRERLATFAQHYTGETS